MTSPMITSRTSNAAIDRIIEERPVFDDRGGNYQTKLTDPTQSKLNRVLAASAPQAALVLEYLGSGRGLSQLIAHTVLGVTSLTTRIAELRKVGINIAGRWQKDHSGKRFMVYHYSPDLAVHGDEPLNLYAASAHRDDQPL